MWSPRIATPHTRRTRNRKILQSEYEPIRGDPMFGDLVTLLNTADEAVHACVYVADDFVFTKNGINSAQPWVLMRMSDMLLMYCAPGKSAKMVFLRRKEWAEKQQAPRSKLHRGSKSQAPNQLQSPKSELQTRR